MFLESKLANSLLQFLSSSPIPYINVCPKLCADVVFYQGIYFSYNNIKLKSRKALNEIFVITDSTLYILCTTLVNRRSFFFFWENAYISPAIYGKFSSLMLKYNWNCCLKKTQKCFRRSVYHWRLFDRSKLNIMQL